MPFLRYLWMEGSSLRARKPKTDKQRIQITGEQQVLRFIWEGKLNKIK